MSLLLNALKKAEEGENKDGQTPAPESGAQASEAPASASAPAASAAAPAAPAARPGGLAGGGLSLKKTETTAAPAPSLEAADADAEPEAGGGEERARTTAARIFRGGAGIPGEGEEGASPFRAARNFLVAAALLAVVGGGGYFVLDAGFIPGVSVQSVAQLFGLGDKAPAPVASRGPAVSFDVDQGAVLRLPRPAVDVQSEIVFTENSPESSAGAINEPQVQQIAALVEGLREEKRAEWERERREQEERLALELPEEALEDVILPDEGLETESAAASDVLSDEVFTANESRAEKARIESMTPSDEHIRIISASQKVAMMMEMEAEKAEMEMEAAAAEAAAEEGEVAEGVEGVEGAEVAQAESEAPAPTPAPAPEKAPMEEEKMAMEKEEMVAPSMRGEERRVALERAKGFYLAGRLEAAEAAYRAVLRRDANNLDALRGIAQIAVSSGRRQLATTMYLRILDLYPRDPVSVAELANLQEGGDPRAMERMIRDSLGKLPEADARLYFALGNLYAGRELWSQAQQAYFEAVTLEEDNPDYTYNLAVVLDYLNRPLLAARYYRRAVELAENSPSGFNLARTRARIQDLEQ